MTKKVYVGTLNELQTHLNNLLEEGATILGISILSQLEPAIYVFIICIQ